MLTPYCYIGTLHYTLQLFHHHQKHLLSHIPFVRQMIQANQRVWRIFQRCQKQLQNYKAKLHDYKPESIIIAIKEQVYKCNSQRCIGGKIGAVAFVFASAFFHQHILHTACLSINAILVHYTFLGVFMLTGTHLHKLKLPVKSRASYGCSPGCY